MAVSITQPDGPAEALGWGYRTTARWAKRCMRLSSSTKGGRCYGATVYASPLSPRCPGVDCLRVWCSRPVASCSTPKGWQEASCEDPLRGPAARPTSENVISAYFERRRTRSLTVEAGKRSTVVAAERIFHPRNEACLQVSCDEAT